MVASWTGASLAVIVRKRVHVMTVVRSLTRNVHGTVLVTGLSSDYRPTLLPPWYCGPVVTG
jgi:hypothetical protein